MIAGKKRKRRNKKLPRIKVKSASKLFMTIKQEIVEDVVVEPTCQYCRKTFRSYYSKVLHEDYSCISNPQKLRREENLSQIKREKWDERKNFQCEKCYQTFANEGKMKNHLNTGPCQIKDEKPKISLLKNYLHSCTKCNACFNARHNLMRHMRNNCRS